MACCPRRLAACRAQPSSCCRPRARSWASPLVTRLRSRGRSRARSWAAPLVLIGVGWASKARAAPPTPLRVAYAAPSACPTRAAFVAEILARTSLARLARGHEPAQSVTVSIERRRESWIGTLSLQAPGGETARRRVGAPSCTEVASALALVAALAIDPEASTEPLPLAKPPAPAKPQPKPKPKPKSKSKPKPRREPPAAVAAPPRPARRLGPARWRFGAGAATGLVGAVAPGVAPELRGLVAVVRTPRGAWAPAFSISAAVAERTTPTEQTSTKFTWIAARLDACPVLWRALPDLDVRPCAGLDVGALRAESVGAAGLQSTGPQTRLWLSGDGFFSVGWRVSSFLELRGAAGALVPVRRDTFILTEAAGRVVTVHQAPPVSGEGELGLMYWF